MKKIVFLAFSLIITMIFSGCAQKKISPEKLKTISKIGVLSLHGNSMESIERGLTIFGNEDTVSDISKWEIDKFMSKELKKALEEKNYKVIRINTTNNDALNYDSEDQSFRVGFLKKLTKENNVDSLIVIVKGNYVPETHDYTRGIAIIKGKALGMENTSIKLNLYLEGSMFENGEIKLLHFNRINGFKEIPNEWWTNTKEPIGINSIDKIEPEIKSILSKYIKYLINEAGY